MEIISSFNPEIRCRCEEWGRAFYITTGERITARLLGVSEEFAHRLTDTWEAALDEALDSKNKEDA